MSDDLISPYEHVISTEFDGGEGVLVDLRTKKYFQLNESGMLIWRGLENGRTLSEIVSDLTDTYEVSAESANASFDRFVSSLKASRLVQ
jgi:Coenzyme PQQ synthesis protein D (PqqD)